MEYGRQFNCLGAGIALMLLCAFLSACGGSEAVSTGVDKAVAPVGSVDDYASADQLQRLPGFPPSGGVSPILRQGQVLESLSRTGDQTYQHSLQVIVDDITHTTTLYTSSDSYCWASYQFGDLVYDRQPLMITIELAPPLAEHFYVGVSDYWQQAWHWQQVEIVEDSIELLIPAGINPCDKHGEMYVCIVAPLGEYVEVAQVGLELDVPAPYPVGLTASDGDYPTKIELTWEDPAVTYDGLVYEEVRIYRLDETYGNWTGIAHLPPGTTSYAVLSTPASPLPLNHQFTFYARTVVANRPGPHSPAVGGSCGWPDFNFNATNGEYADKVVISWTELPFVDAYQVQVRIDGEYTELATIADPAVTSLEHRWDWPVGKECEYDKIYRYRVIAVCGSEELESGYRTGKRSLTKPRLEYASYGVFQDKVRLIWSDLTPAPAYYKVYRDGTEEEHLIGTTPGPDNWDDTDVDQYQHTYYVQACFQNEASDISNEDYGFKAASAWQYHEPDPAEQNRSRCLATLIDGKPAVVYRTSPDGIVKYMYAPGGVPGSAGDWVQSIALIDAAWPWQLVDADGRPALILDGYHLSIALAATATPGSPSDWQVHEIDEHSWGRNPAAVVHNGSIMVCYRAGDGLRFARSSSLTPAGSSDWQIHSLGLEGSTKAQGIALAVVGGYPAICYYCKEGSEEYPLAYVRALVAEPSAPADWARHEIESDSHASAPVLLVIDDRPVALYYMNYPIYYPRLTCATASSSYPTDSLDWTTHIADPAFSSTFAISSATIIDNRICVSHYSVNSWPEDYDIYCSLKFARAQPGIPLNTSSWQTQPVETWTSANADLGQLIGCSGQPLLVYDLDGVYMSGGVRCARLAE